MALNVEFVIETIEIPSEDPNKRHEKRKADVEVAYFSHQGDRTTRTPKIVDEYNLSVWRNTPTMSFAYYKYEEWKSGITSQKGGLSLRDWPEMSASDLNRFLAVGVHTVEGVAEMGEQSKREFGLGAADWKAKAQRWINTEGPRAEDKKRIAEMEAKLARMEALMDNQTAPSSLTDLESLTKAQLAEEAAKKGLELNPDKLNKAEMIEALKTEA